MKRAEYMMQNTKWWMAAFLSGAVLAAGCGGEDVGSGDDVQDVSDMGGESDAGEDAAGDAGDEPDTADGDVGDTSDGGDEPDVADGDVGDDAGNEDSGDVIVPDDCPSGQRANKGSGECEVVLTLMIYTQDLQSYLDGELASEQRGMLVCASMSASSGSLPRETLAQGERCRVYGAGQEVSEITAYDVGPVTVFGLNNVNPAAFSPNEFGSCYSPPQGLNAQFVFEREAELRLVSAGNDADVDAVFPAFDRMMQTIAPAEFEYDAIVPGEAMDLTWTANADASEVRIDVDGR